MGIVKTFVWNKWMLLLAGPLNAEDNNQGTWGRRDREVVDTCKSCDVENRETKRKL